MHPEICHGGSVTKSKLRQLSLKWLNKNMCLYGGEEGKHFGLNEKCRERQGWSGAKNLLHLQASLEGFQKAGQHGRAVRGTWQETDHLVQL